MDFSIPPAGFAASLEGLPGIQVSFPAKAEFAQYAALGVEEKFH